MPPKVTRRGMAGSKGQTTTRSKATTGASSSTNDSIGSVFGVGLVGISVAVFTLAVGLHLNTLDHEFVFDDARGVVTNKDVLQQNPIADVWKDDFWGKPMSRFQSHKSYRPLTVLSFRANHAVGQLDPYGYHVVNVLLHALVCVLFLRVGVDFVTDRHRLHREPCLHLDYQAA